MKNISSKLVKIMAELKYVQKTGFNSFHKYNYVSASDISKKVNESLTKHGVATYVNHEVLSFESVTNLKGNQEKLAVVKVNVSFIDSETGEVITSSGLGSGQDSGDKAIMKAETAGLKYVFVQMFSIETGDKQEDPEHDSSVDERMNNKPTQPVQAPTQVVPKISLAPQANQTRHQAPVTQISVKSTTTSDCNDDDYYDYDAYMKNKEIEKINIPTQINQEEQKCACIQCNRSLTAKVVEYSQRKFKKLLCVECQTSLKDAQTKNQAHG